MAVAPNLSELRSHGVRLDALLDYFMRSRKAQVVAFSPFTVHNRPAGLLLTPGAGSDRNHRTLVALENSLDLPIRRITLGTNRVEKAVTKIVQTAEAFADQLQVELNQIAYGGRSFGGRSCSIAVAQGLPAAALILLSYPLHPPGKPDSLRVDHFDQITIPTLFISGRKDPFGTPEEFETHIPTIVGPYFMEWIDGNHAPKDDEAIIEEIRVFLQR